VGGGRGKVKEKEIEQKVTKGKKKKEYYKKEL
jgi:hypothetical protein